MLSPHEVQAAFITLLQGNAALVAALAGPEAIKEAEWAGSSFDYPAVRLDIADMRPQGNGACAARWLSVTGSIIVLSKGDSSAECLTVLGLVQNAIQGRHLTGAGLTSLEVRVEQAIYPYREDNIWRGEIPFATTVIQT